MSVVDSITVIVGKDNMIRARREPRTKGSISGCDVILDPVRQQTIKALINILRDNRLRDRDEFEALGANLYSVLFDNEIGDAVHEALTSDQRALTLLKVELEFEAGQEELASWPWEYLFCPVQPGKGGTGYFLATKTRLVLTRHLSLGLSMRPLTVEKEQLPVRVLFVASSPVATDGDELPPVLYESVLEELESLQSSDAKIEVIDLVDSRLKSEDMLSPDDAPRATLSNFLDLVRNIEPHVIHFVGHGRCTGEGGQIAFMSEDRTADWVADRELAEWLMEIHSLRLVFLQACESALPDPHHAISGVAKHLAHKNIPAVVAMQYRVENEVANMFAGAFYRALAASESIDVAVQAGRREIETRIRDLARSRAFGLPVLYLSQSDSLLPPEVHTPPPEGPQATAIACPWCEEKCEPTQSGCTKCGGDLRCTKCGALIKPNSNFCGQCKSKLTPPPSLAHKESLEELDADRSDLETGRVARIKADVEDEWVG